jgi:hypothetical protein
VGVARALRARRLPARDGDPGEVPAASGPPPDPASAGRHCLLSLVTARKIADRQTQSRDGVTVKNDHSLLVWVLDQTLGLLLSSARTAEQEEAVKELRTLALLPKPDKAKIKSLVHRLGTMGSIKPEPMQTRRTPKRAGVTKHALFASPLTES